MAVTLGYIGYIVVHDLPAVVGTLLPFSWSRTLWLLAATALIALCTTGSALSYYFLVSSQSSARVSVRQALRLYLFANLMRHLPGRFVGVAYQATLPLPGSSAADMVRVNVMQMLAGLAGNLLMGSGIVLFCRGATAWGVLLAAATLPAMLSLLSLRAPLWLRRWVSTRGPTRLRNLLEQPAPRVRSPAMVAAVLVQIAGWPPYLLAWHLLGNVFPPLANEGLVVLAASYSVAWAIGVLSVVTPGGLGVREAMFLLLGSLSAAREPLVFLTVFARLWALGADVLAWLGAAALLRPHPSQSAALSEHPNP